MKKIAFIGLGIMGSPMAVNLIKSGFDVVGYNRTAAKLQPLVDAGGRAASSIAEAVAGADAVALMVSDSPDVTEILTREDGVFAHGRAGALIIDFSSIRPDVAADLAREASTHGFDMLDAPVSGGQVGAQSASLSIMVGGSASGFAAAQPIFNAVGKTVIHVGTHGTGQTVKAANQMIVAGNIALLAEAVVFLEAHRVDTQAAIQVLGAGLAGSAVLDQKAEKMLARSFTPGFRVNLHHKDMAIATTAAREQGVVVPVTATVAQLMASAVANDDGELDHSALFNTIKRLSGGECSSDAPT